MYPSANCGAVATGEPDGIWLFEADSPNVLDRIATETNHDLLTEVPTYLVRSRAGRGHCYFRNTDASIAMGNISQTAVRYGDFSIRVQNAYVVAAGSTHPETKQPYVALNPEAPILPAPDWFVEWCQNQRTEKSPKVEGQYAKDERGLIAHGQIHGWMVEQAGRMRNMGMSPEVIEIALLEITHKYCAPPINEAQVRQTASSMGKYEPGIVGYLVLNQKPDFQPPPEELPQPVSYPKFPKYVWAGTSIYENFVKPMVAQNSRIDYFMWLSAMVMQQNYLGTKIKLKGQFATNFINMGQYLVLIGKRGETHKSESVNDAMEYFKYIGCLTHNGGGLKTADGRSVVWTAGSMEGVGIEAQKTNCKNIILFYDELEQLVKKAGIESSTVNSTLLAIAESKKFGNTVKSMKEAYSIEPGTYVASLLTCTTPPKFNALWPQMGASDSGMNDRVMFVVQPEKLPERSMFVSVNFLETSHKTRLLIDKAIMQGEFMVENELNPRFQLLVSDSTAREAIRAIKWGLAIAIDLGLTSIDDECLERGVDIVRYEQNVKAWLRTVDAENKEAALQNLIRQTLEQAGGTLPHRELQRRVHSDRKGTSQWGAALYGLVRAGILAQEDQTYRVLIPRDVESE